MFEAGFDLLREKVHLDLGSLVEMPFFWLLVFLLFARVLCLDFSVFLYMSVSFSLAFLSVCLLSVVAWGFSLFLCQFFLFARCLLCLDFSVSYLFMSV